MDDSVQSTIAKIKIQEKEKEEKLKEKRECENAMAVLNRAVHDTESVVERLIREIQEQTTRVDRCRLDLDKEMIRQNVLMSQLEECSKELDRLRAKADTEVSNVWELRSSMCMTVQNTANEWDIQSLLTKRVTPEPSIKVVKKLPTKEIDNEKELKTAKENLEMAIKERDRLLREPEVGDDFVRNCLQITKRRFCSKIEAGENVPIKFTTSAASRKIISPVMRKTDGMPWYQPFSVVGSVAVFLIYFCYLREENDIDLEFSKTLYDRIKGLEKEQLLQTYKFNKEQGKSVAEIEKRLQELEEDEAKLSSSNIS